ncbi:MAG: alginate lyase family protein, partial [Microbispora sp.]|nr:alginate lyase family protein [Microbispora sp.]
WEEVAGFRLQEAAARRWAHRWRAEWGGRPLRDWLLRPGAGRFWIPVEEAEIWAARSCTVEDLRLADEAVRGEVTLLGVERAQVGAEPTFRLDLYSGAEWPLERSHGLRLARGDGSDVRTVWEQSRSYEIIALARAYWASGRAEYRDAFARRTASWIAHNPVGRGPNWASPMDAAIRAANWALGVVLFAGADGLEPVFWQRMLANLYLTGLYLERHLEWHPRYRGNHFVANGVGLVYLGSLFRGCGGDRWLRAGARILAEEIEYQVGPDGVSFEASLAYHRLVTELFAYGGLLVRLNLPARWTPTYEERLRRMYRFIATYLPDSGEAPMIGDADDGRLHAVSARGLLEPRRHALGLPDEFWPTDRFPRSTAFASGGFYVLRRGADHVVVRCGPVGLLGAGSHDHNDQLGFEMVLGGRRVVSDSGTYAYTRDLGARYAFRSTAAHSVVQVGGEEQNPITATRPWRVLADRTRAECVAWSGAEDVPCFEGVHGGYAHRASGAMCRRRIRACPDGAWEVLDRVEGTGREALVWRLHLTAGEVSLQRHPDEAVAVLAGDPPVRIRVVTPQGLGVRLARTQASERYGERTFRPCLEAVGEVELPVEIIATFRIDA